jgi:hypothetical protein
MALQLDGWNYIPSGYGMTVDTEGAPGWLRAWLRVPYLDRFAYPVAVRRGIFYLTPAPEWPESEREPVPPGWRVEAEHT